MSYVAVYIIGVVFMLFVAVMSVLGLVYLALDRWLAHKEKTNA